MLNVKLALTLDQTIPTTKTNQFKIEIVSFNTTKKYKVLKLYG